MNKKVLVISTSPRKGGNSDTLADFFIQGAREKGHAVEKVTLFDAQIGFCKGCLTCQSTQKCIIQDDANAIIEKMKEADVLVFATPIYYYGLSGQMKRAISTPPTAPTPGTKPKKPSTPSEPRTISPARMPGQAAWWIRCRRMRPSL